MMEKTLDVPNEKYVLAKRCPEILFFPRKKVKTLFIKKSKVLDYRIIAIIL